MSITVSDTKPTTSSAIDTTTRPWGDRPVASGVEAVFAWAKKELALLEERAGDALDAAHNRIDELEKKLARATAPTPVQPAQTVPAPQIGGAISVETLQGAMEKGASVGGAASVSGAQS